MMGRFLACNVLAWRQARPLHDFIFSTIFVEASRPVQQVGQTMRLNSPDGNPSAAQHYDSRQFRVAHDPLLPL